MPSDVKFLLVEDHEIMRRGVRSLIERRAGWRVIAEASDGQTAAKLALATSPDIVITDFSLPGLNGLDLTRRLKRDNPNIQVLVYTMHDNQDIALELLRAGARGYVYKTDTADQLISAIEALTLGQPYLTGELAETLMDRFQTSEHGSISSTLTAREREVIQLVAQGRTNKEISTILDIKLKTAEAHRFTAMQKLGLTGTADVVRYAVRNMLIEL